MKRGDAFVRLCAAFGNAMRPYVTMALCDVADSRRIEQLLRAADSVSPIWGRDHFELADELHAFFLGDDPPYGEDQEKLIGKAHLAAVFWWHMAHGQMMASGSERAVLILVAWATRDGPRSIALVWDFFVQCACEYRPDDGILTQDALALGIHLLTGVMLDEATQHRYFRTLWGGNCWPVSDGLREELRMYSNGAAVDDPLGIWIGLCSHRDARDT